MMMRRGLVALLLGVVATCFEPAVGFLIPSGPASKAVSGRGQHHQVGTHARWMQSVMMCLDSIVAQPVTEPIQSTHTLPTTIAADGDRRGAGACRGL